MERKPQKVLAQTVAHQCLGLVAKLGDEFIISKESDVMSDFFVV